MTAQILDGKAILATIKSELKERVAALAERGVTPGLGDRIGCIDKDCLGCRNRGLSAACHLELDDIEPCNVGRDRRIGGRWAGNGGGAACGA